MMGRPKTKRRRAAEASTPVPRPPDADQALADLRLMESAGLRAAIELRHLGMGVTADALCDLLDRIHHIRGGAAAQIREAENRALLAGISAMVGDEMEAAGLAAGHPTGDPS